MILCLHYGDQLTEIVFEPSDYRFSKISNIEIDCVGLAWCEHNSDVVITGRNYSLDDPKTIRCIAQMASEQLLLRCIHTDEAEDNSLSISKHLKKLGFEDGYNEWQKIKKEILLSIK